jgi:L-seryl-tRNA(Ser) seleniumtransferase
VQDYEKAMGPKTGLLVKVHTSNYRVKGFTNEVEARDLIRLGNKRKVPVYFDMGGGVFFNLKKIGLPYEPIVSDCVKFGFDIISFSGDKMLGGPQCGILIGKREYIEKVKRNPLMRTVRCGKLTYAALEPTLRLFLKEEELVKSNPVISMLSQSQKDLEKKCNKLLKGVKKKRGTVCEKTVCYSQTGGGALPLQAIKSVGVRIKSQETPLPKLYQAMSGGSTPVVGYIKDEYFYLDMRTIRDDEINAVVKAINTSLH